MKNIRSRKALVGTVALVALVLLLVQVTVGIPKEIWGTLKTIGIGLGVLALVLTAMYGVTVKLPGRWRERAQAVVFLFPAIFALFAGLFVPALKTIYASLRDDDLRRTKYVGLKNFREIFTSSDARLVVFNTFAWVILGTLAVVILSLTVARFADAIKGERIVKSLLFIPTCVSLAGAGIIWKFVYASPPSKVGLLSAITKAANLPNNMGGDGQQLWLTERGFGGLKPPATAPGFNTLLLIVIFIWASTGVATMILSAAIKGVPESLVEAAKIDGATNRQAFYKVTLPYIRSTIVTVATFTVVAAFKAYDIVAGTIGGNAGTSTIANEWYVKYFLQDREGYSSALAVLMFVLVIPFVVLNRRAQRRAEEMMAG
jgi:alpha-glucoside transport system permease protein